MAVGQKQWYHFGVGAPPILGPILVVGLNRMFTGGTQFLDFDPLPRVDRIRFVGTHLRQNPRSVAQRLYSQWVTPASELTRLGQFPEVTPKNMREAEGKPKSMSPWYDLQTQPKFQTKVRTKVPWQEKEGLQPHYAPSTPEKPAVQQATDSLEGGGGLLPQGTPFCFWF